MANKLAERRSFRLALETYLVSKGWAGITYKEGFQSESTLTIPTVAVHFLPSTKAPVQIGSTSEKLFIRVVQVDAYMESEARADAILDDVMDFLDIVPVIILDNVSSILGTLVCNDTNSIYSSTHPPRLTDPKILRWRGIARATMDAFYNAP